MTPVAANIFLHTFCDFGNPYQPYLNTPWQDDEFAYASNGHWVVRMPLAAFGGALFIKALPLTLPVTDHFKVFDSIAMAPMEPTPCTACATCGATGYANPSKCTQCNGEGEVPMDDGWGSCPACEGWGDIFTPALHPLFTPDAPAHRCPHCQATGFERSPSAMGIVAYRGSWFQNHYLAYVSRLPGVEFSAALAPVPYTTPGTSTAAQHAGAFRFDGGLGMLMPCRVPGSPKLALVSDQATEGGAP